MSEAQREGNAITQEEFQKLEKQESGKKGLFSRIVSKGKGDTSEPPKKASPPKAPQRSLNDNELTDELYGLNEKFDKLMVDVEKQAGKLEMYEEEKASLAQRISDLASQLGELRSVIVSRERSFDKIESDFAKIQEEVNSISPKSIQKNFEVFESKQIKTESEIEKLNIQLKKVEETVSGFEATMKRIKSYDNLFKMLDKIGHKVSEITATKGYIDRMTAKTESIFSELSEKTQILDSQEERLKANETLIHDMAKDLDKIGLLVKDGARREDVTKMKKELEVVKKDVFKKDMEGFMKVFQAAPPERYVAQPAVQNAQSSVHQQSQVSSGQHQQAQSQQQARPKEQTKQQPKVQTGAQAVTNAQSAPEASADTSRQAQPSSAVKASQETAQGATRVTTKPATDKQDQATVSRPVAAHEKTQARQGVQQAATGQPKVSQTQQPTKPAQSSGPVPTWHEGLYKLKEEVDRMRRQDKPSSQAEIKGQYLPLVNFIKAALARGISKKMLKDKLLSVGWKEEIIDRHLQ